MASLRQSGEPWRVGSGYPTRWPVLAGWLFGAMLVLLQGQLLLASADEPKEELTQEQREKLESRAGKLDKQADEFYQQGRYADATKLLEKSLQLQRRLYPKEQYPRGHPDLASILHNLGAILGLQGEFGNALQHSQEALAMCEALYPKAEFPQGHADLASNLNNLGMILHRQGDYERALPYHQKAHAMYASLYPKDKYPEGNLVLAANLNNIGTLLQDQGEYQRALPYLLKSLAMLQALYPKDKFPRGHVHLASGLNNIGELLRHQGEYQRACRICRRIWPCWRHLPQGSVSPGPSSTRLRPEQPWPSALVAGRVR